MCFRKNRFFEDVFSNIDLFRGTQGSNIGCLTTPKGHKSMFRDLFLVLIFKNFWSEVGLPRIIEVPAQEVQVRGWRTPGCSQRPPPIVFWEHMFF